MHEQEKNKHQEKSSFVNKLTQTNLDLKQKIVILEKEKKSLEDSLQNVTVQLGYVRVRVVTNLDLDTVPNPNLINP